MSGDLISREALRDKVRTLKVEAEPFQNSAYKTGYISALSTVEGVLAYADAVEVVRCKDCIHSEELPSHTRARIGFVPGTMRCTLGRGTLVKGYSVIHPKEFCSGATKKMDGKG